MIPGVEDKVLVEVKVQTYYKIMTDRSITKSQDGCRVFLAWPWVRLPGGGLYELYRYVQPQRVWFSSCFSLKMGLTILVSNWVWFLTGSEIMSGFGFGDTPPPKICNLI